MDAAERAALGQFNEALADYDALIQREPREASAFLRQGSLYVRMGRKQKPWRT